MLVLTRKQDETIFIGEEIRIMVIGISRTQVKLGIACPSHLAVARGELGPRIRKKQWPNLTPDEMRFLLSRLEALSEWYYMDRSLERKREREDLEAVIDQLKEQAFKEQLEAHSDWYSQRGEH